MTDGRVSNASKLKLHSRITDYKTPRSTQRATLICAEQLTTKNSVFSNFIRNPNLDKLEMSRTIIPRYMLSTRVTTTL